ncbi:MAG: hydrogenase maturation nickel metallochaperone HypA [Synergistaceae bacterium]|nr:hydrogenase maturation nickel metallochaperone HypA [Synergistaceae bacterium]
MYEFSLTNSITRSIVNLCRQSGWSKIYRVMIRVGGMRKVNPELMSFIFSAAAKDTPAEGAVMSVMVIPVTLHCYACGRTNTREDTQFLCPSCGSRNVQLLSGLEFNLEALEVGF